MKKYIDCSKIKGVDYTPSYAHNDLEEWRDYDKAVVEKELSYAARMGLNCIRPFLNFTVYAADREKFLDSVLHMVRTADSLGMKVMPTVFDSCFSEIEPSVDLNINEWIPNPGVMNLGEDSWAKEEEYCLDLINLLKNENGLLMWDIMNEPLCTAYVGSHSPEVNAQHKEEIYKFLKHFCDFFREHDDVNSITVGHADCASNNETGDWVDILSFHRYPATEKSLDDSFRNAMEMGKKYGKQMFCSETGCAGRANPYDLAIETANKYNCGYFVWELMIGESFWNDRHGIVYPDGTIRDAATVAAIGGFFRNRDTRKPYNANTEGAANGAVSRIENWLNSDSKNIEAGLETVSMAANLLESNLLIPECDLPTAAYRALTKKNDLTSDDITEILSEWLPVLKADIEKHK